jgi:hypothetical protein
MRASTLAVDLVSMVILLGCITTTLALPGLGKWVIPRDASGDTSHEDSRYGLDGGSFNQDGNAAANYPPPYGYQPPQTTSNSSVSASASSVQSSLPSGSSSSASALSSIETLSSSGGSITRTGKIQICSDVLAHIYKTNQVLLPLHPCLER